MPDKFFYAGSLPIDKMPHKLTEYEAEQFSPIQAWKIQDSRVVSKFLGTVFAPVSWLVQKLIPEKAIRVPFMWR